MEITHYYKSGRVVQYKGTHIRTEGDYVYLRINGVVQKVHCVTTAEIPNMRLATTMED